jgi:hypothetical protein
MKRCGAFFVSAAGRQAMVRFRACESSFLRVTTNQFKVVGLGTPASSAFSSIALECTDLAELYGLSTVQPTGSLFPSFSECLSPWTVRLRDVLGSTATA